MWELKQHIEAYHLTVYVSEFRPAPGDVVSYHWRDPSGEPHELKMPTFCLVNIEKIKLNLKTYIYSAKWQYLESLKAEDELAWMTICTAVRYAKAKPVCVTTPGYRSHADRLRTLLLRTP